MISFIQALTFLVLSPTLFYNYIISHSSPHCLPLFIMPLSLITFTILLKGEIINSRFFLNIFGFTYFYIFLSTISISSFIFSIYKSKIFKYLYGWIAICILPFSLSNSVAATYCSHFLFPCWPAIVSMLAASISNCLDR